MDRVQEECKAFIEQYRQAECLWNTRIPEYKNYTIRAEAYKQLAVMFNITVEQAKKRICNYRSRYSLEKIKIQESILQGKSKVYTPKKSWFKYLTFLDDVLVQRTKLNDSEIKIESFDHESDSDGERKHSRLRVQKRRRSDSIDENSITQIDEDFSRLNEHERILETSINMNNKQLKKKIYNVIETIIQACQNDNNTIDEFDTFGKSVAAQLKALPYDKALKLQMQLQEQISLFKLRVLQQEDNYDSS